ncbi:MAG: hypothetical protein AAB647_02815 [Patescibacteria group bacterium]
MLIRDGWKIIRSWRIPWGDSITRAKGRKFGGAQEATKQPLMAAPPIDWFSEIREQPLEDNQPGSLATKPYLLGRYGFDQVEQAILLDQAGSEEQLCDLITWVEKAHKRLKMFVLLERKLEPTVKAIQEAHEPAVEKLAKILVDTNEKENDEAWRIRRRRQSAEEIRGEIHRKIPGLVFPRAGSKAELEEWIAAASNINCWLAQHGTFACRCRALNRG